MSPPRTPNREIVSFRSCVRACVRAKLRCVSWVKPHFGVLLLRLLLLRLLLLAKLGALSQPAAKPSENFNSLMGQEKQTVRKQ